MTGEDRLIAWLRRQMQARAADLLGDDAAVLADGAGRAGGDQVVTVDQQIAGTHFPADLSPAVVARRLVAVSLSDLAAMGAEPRHAFLALTMPESFAARPFLRAVLAACDDWETVLAGGDLARGPVLAASLTLCGRRWHGGRIVRRSNARAGDALWLGGTVGESAAGRQLIAQGARSVGRGVRLPANLALSPAQRRAASRAVRRHLEPTPQLELGRWLAGRRRAAAIDISDGLALDLHRLCRESGVGAEIDAARLPLTPRLAELAAKTGRQALHLALTGGEDYVLLFALPPTVQPPAHFAARRIGQVIPHGVRLLAEGRERRLSATGWDHLR